MGSTVSYPNMKEMFDGFSIPEYTMKRAINPPSKEEQRTSIVQSTAKVMAFHFDEEEKWEAFLEMADVAYCHILEMQDEIANGL